MLRTLMMWSVVTGSGSIIGACAIAGEAPPLGDVRRLPTVEAPLFWGGDGTHRYIGANPPTVWNAGPAAVTDGSSPAPAGILWKVDLPTAPWVVGRPDKNNVTRIQVGGMASPLACGDRVYVTAAPAAILALSAQDGAVIWRHDLDPVASIMDETTRSRFALAWKACQDDNQGTAPPDPTPYRKTLADLGLIVIPDWRHRGWMMWTPATDGERVVVTSGLGLVTVLSAKDGARRWQRAGMGFVRAPVLAGDRVIVLAETNPERFMDPKTLKTLREKTGNKSQNGTVLAFSLDDGRQVWAAPWSQGRYHGGGSPLVVSLGGRQVVVVSDGQVLDAQDGSVVADLGAACGLQSAPTAVAGRLFMPHGDYGAKPAQVVIADLSRGLVAPDKAVPATTAPKETAPDPARATVPILRRVDMPGGGAHVRSASCLVVDDLVFVPSLFMTYWFRANDATSIPTQVLPSRISCYAGSVLGGTHVYAFNDTGDCLVFSTKNGKPELLGRNPGPQPVAPPAFLGDRIFLRTATGMMCIGNR